MGRTLHVEMVDSEDTDLARSCSSASWVPGPGCKEVEFF